MSIKKKSDKQNIQDNYYIIRTKNGIDLFDIILTDRTEKILVKHIFKINELKNKEKEYFIEKKYFNKIHYTQKVLINYFTDIINSEQQKCFLDTIPKLKKDKNVLDFLKR